MVLYLPNLLLGRIVLFNQWEDGQQSKILIDNNSHKNIKIINDHPTLSIFTPFVFIIRVGKKFMKLVSTGKH
jgi:hypothetical protein